MSRVRDESMNAVPIDGSGRVHAIYRPTAAPSQYNYLYCNGRAVSGMVGTTADVTCKACRKAIDGRAFLAEAEGGAR